MANPEVSKEKKIAWQAIERMFQQEPETLAPAGDATAESKHDESANEKTEQVDAARLTAEEARVGWKGPRYVLDYSIDRAVIATGESCTDETGYLVYVTFRWWMMEKYDRVRYPKRKFLLMDEQNVAEWKKFREVVLADPAHADPEHMTPSIFKPRGFYRDQKTTAARARRDILRGFSKTERAAVKGLLESHAKPPAGSTP